ncbi:hypothetical protein CBR_g30694 [Chara braunii]|uniref:Reverse transcriptase domain-containing protein n=1 Tax=Chara braunii TaxID=69332 RepID=A0A388LDE4_CHABU|nr:hypothetical protein CBR_g30694 [Chara braunii]|eukprot:GBG80326.1 hypothetical protein CBR_g30694 [Chara braunii]
MSESSEGSEREYKQGGRKGKGKSGGSTEDGEQNLKNWLANNFGSSLKRILDKLDSVEKLKEVETERDRLAKLVLELEAAKKGESSNNEKRKRILAVNSPTAERPKSRSRSRSGEVKIHQPRIDVEEAKKVAMNETGSVQTKVEPIIAQVNEIQLDDIMKMLSLIVGKVQGNNEDTGPQQGAGKVNLVINETDVDEEESEESGSEKDKLQLNRGNCSKKDKTEVGIVEYMRQRARGGRTDDGESGSGTKRVRDETGEKVRENGNKEAKDSDENQGGNPSPGKTVEKELKGGKPMELDRSEDEAEEEKDPQDKKGKNADLERSEEESMGYSDSEASDSSPSNMDEEGSEPEGSDAELGVDELMEEQGEVEDNLEKTGNNPSEVELEDLQGKGSVPLSIYKFDTTYISKTYGREDTPVRKSIYISLSYDKLRHSATSDTVPRQQCHISNMTGLPGQLANEPIADYKKRFQAQLAAIEAEEQRQLAAKAAQLQAEEAATAEKLRLQAEADADAQARRKEAQDLLLRHEANSIERLKYWHFEPNGDEATPEEQHKELMAKLVTRLVYTCNHLQSELANLQRAVRNHKTQHEDATRALDAHVHDLEQVPPKPDVGASSTASSSRQLEERVDHVVAMLGNISTFVAPTTISSQLHTLKTEFQQLKSTNADGNPKLILPIAKHAYIGALFMNSKGGCQTWLTHLATSHGVDVPDLKDNITWEQLTRLWKKRLIVDDAPALAINRLFTMSQGNTATRDWLTEWQKIAAVPNLDLIFMHLRREFYNRSCADREQYSTFAEIIDKAREIIKTNSSAEGEATPPSTPPDSAALLAASCTSGEDANVAGSRYIYEDYAVHLVPPLDQPLHVQQSTACTVSSPSATDSAASPPFIVGDSSSWSRLEVLDPLTFTNFQWMPVPPTGRLPKPHCNVLMAPLWDYLHTAVPTPLMDAGVEVVDLHVYIAKIDREFKTQRYDDIDAPLLYVRIQIREATCSALIDCGASRNYISQDFMVRAGLGPRVRRKPQPTQVTLADGHTHKSIDRCIDSVPVYFAPHASEAVSFDILDTKFNIILGMSWLRSKDHPVNFFNRTVHVRDRNGVLVPCTVPLPHPSISCHVVSAASILASIIRDDIEEMGTIRNAGPLPRIDDLLERLGGAKFFSKLDLKSEYHQLEIRKEDRYKTTFKTRYGHFEWLVMPFGLTNVPATLQAAMTTEFRHMLYRYVLIYLDDILVYSRSLEEHVEHLRTVLERLRQAKYKANRDKCEFARQELEYLGHYVTPQGIRPLADKIEALQVWPDPTNTTDVRSFMGLAGYYQRFITGYSRIAAPMTRLQSPKVPFVFDNDPRRSFQALKTAMLMAPVLSIYDPTLPTRVTTDASGYGIGAVLEQHNSDD